MSRRVSCLLAIALLLLMARLAPAQESRQDTNLVKVRMISVEDKKRAEQIYEEIQQGGSFADLAKTYSVGPNAANGGYIGVVDLRQVDKEIATALAALQPGQTTQPFRTGDKYSLLQLTTDEHYEKGRQLFAQGQLREAGKEFVRDLRLNPDSAYSLFYVGLIHSKLGNLDKAISAFRRSLEQNDALVESYYNLGIVYRKKGMVAEAIEMYKSAIDKDPGFHPAYNNLAWIYAVNRQNLEEAQGLSQTAISLAPDQPDYYDTLSRIFFEMGNYDEAVAQLNKAISLAPDNEYYRQQLERYHMASGQAVAAVSLEKVPEEESAATGASLTRNGAAEEKPAQPTATEERQAPSAKEERATTEQAPRKQPEPAVKKRATRTASARTERGSKHATLSIEVRNGNGRKGAALAMAQKLKAMNYSVTKYGNANHFNWKRTTVFYKPAVLDQALDLAHKLEGEQDVLKMKESSPFDLIIIVGKN